MEYLKKIEAILKRFKELFWFVVVLTLLVVIYFKNTTLKSLREALAEKPKIEYIYRDSVEVIEKEKPVPVEVVKWKEKIVVETDSVPIELTQADSAQIAGAYIQLYEDFNTTNIYNDTLKNDTTAFISLYEEVTRNEIFNRKLTFEDRTPIVQITNTVVKQDKTTSIIGGIDASIGREYNSLSLGVGLVTPKNSVYIFRYDPVNKAYGGSINLPIFNFYGK